MSPGATSTRAPGRPGTLTTTASFCSRKKAARARRDVNQAAGGAGARLRVVLAGAGLSGNLDARLARPFFGKDGALMMAGRKEICATREPT